MENYEHSFGNVSTLNNPIPILTLNLIIILSLFPVKHKTSGFFTCILKIPVEMTKLKIYYRNIPFTKFLETVFQNGVQLVSLIGFYILNSYPDKQVNEIKFLTLTQIPQPIHNTSEIYAILLSGYTSIHSFPKQ